MDNIIVGQTDDPNYKSVGHLADGTPVYRYDPLPPEKTLVNEKIIEDYNSDVDIIDTKTQELLEQFKWGELRDQEKQNLKDQINKGYVEVFSETSLDLQPRDKSKWNEATVLQSTDSGEYEEQLISLESEDKPKQVKKVDRVEKSVPPVIKKKPIVRPPVDSPDYTDEYKQILEDDSPTVTEQIVEQVKEEPKQPYTDKTLWESYGTTKELEQEIEAREKNVSKSIADCYDESSEHPNEDDSEVLGYFDTPGDKKLSAIGDTAEYLTSHKRSEQDKESKETSRQQRLEESTVSEEEVSKPVKEATEYVERDETETTEYLELFNTQEDQEAEKLAESTRIKDEAEQTIATEKEVKDSKQKKVKEKAKKLKDKRSEVQSDEDAFSEAHITLEKEYFRDLLEKKYASSEVVDAEYRKIKNDLEEVQLQRRDAAILYLKQAQQLTEKNKAILKQYENHIVQVREEISSSYTPLLEDLEQDSPFGGISDEFDHHTINVNMSNRSVTVNEKGTSKSATFNYKGSLATYKIDGYRLELYSISKDPSTMIDPTSFNWFTTHFYLTYDLRTGEVIDHLSHTMVKVDEERHLDEEDYTFEDDSWKHARFEFTTGQGFSFCNTLSSDWAAAHPAHPLSAIAPDGYALGYVRLGVKRTGGNGAITIRYLVKPLLPDFANVDDFTIDWDPADNPEWAGSDVVYGSGYYNMARESLDTEVVLVSSDYNVYVKDPAIPGGSRLGPYGHDPQWNDESTINGQQVDGEVINSLSARWQTLTWATGDYVDKYIYLRHSHMASNVNFQTALKWYGVYLTFDEGLNYNLIADGKPIHNHVRSTAMGAVNASATILPLYEGQGDLGIRTLGDISSPFFVAVSGWSAGQVSQFSCGAYG